MKLKLAALLVFSQSAQAINPRSPEEAARFVGSQALNWHVNEKNYREKMCGDDLFAVPELPDGKVRIIDTHHFSATDSIKLEHDAYCYASTKYKEAVTKKENGSSAPGYADREITKNGMIVATACEQLKVNKKLYGKIWDDYFSIPKPCPSWSR